MKTREWKIRHEIAGVEKAGVENEKGESAKERYLGAEQVYGDEQNSDCYHEVRVSAGVALIDDAAERPDTLLDECTDEHVTNTDQNHREEDDRQIRTTVLTSLDRQVQR